MNLNSKKKAILHQNLQRLFGIFKQYITEDRLYNIENYEKKEFKKIYDVYLRKLMRDVYSKHREEVTFITKENPKAYSKAVLRFLNEEINNNLRVWLKR